MGALGLNLWGLIVQIIAFLVFIYLFWKFALGPITNMLDEREFLAQRFVDQSFCQLHRLGRSSGACLRELHGTRPNELGGSQLVEQADALSLAGVDRRSAERQPRRLPSGASAMWQSGDSIFLTGSGAGPEGDRRRGARVSDC